MWEKLTALLPAQPAQSLLAVASGGRTLSEPAREWSGLGGRDIDHKTRGARVSEREANESTLSEFTCAR